MVRIANTLAGSNDGIYSAEYRLINSMTRDTPEDMMRRVPSR
jgi:hypothetical protein